MRVQKSGHGDFWTVSVDPGELITGSGKPLPYATTIGTINPRGTIKVWTPAASKPRGYIPAAKLMLEDARDDLRNQGLVK